MLFKALMSVTTDHYVRSVSIVRPNSLFTAQLISNTYYAVIVKDGKVITLDSLDFLQFLKAMTSLMSYILRIMKSRYYTFLGECSLSNNILTYEPYVDLMKKVRIEINDRLIKISTNDLIKRLKGTKRGYRPSNLINTIDSIVKLITQD